MLSIAGFTGAKSFRYVRTAPDHYSLAFTYECIAATVHRPYDGFLEYYQRRAAAVEAEESAETADAAALRMAGWPWG